MRSSGQSQLARMTVRHLLVALFTLGVLNLRPGLFGQTLNELLVLVPLAALTSVYLVSGCKPLRIRTNGPLLLLASAFAIFTLLQTLSLDPSGWYRGIALLISLITVSLGAAVLLTRDDVYVVLLTVVWLDMLLACSQLVTYAGLSLGIGDSLRIGSAYLYGDTWPVEWYFPMTLTIGLVKVGSIMFPRALGIFREPGIYQVVVLLGYFALDFLSIRGKGLIRVLLLFSLLTTFSTAGVALWMGCLIYQKTFSSRTGWLKRAISLVVPAGLLALFVYMPRWGLESKLLRNVGRVQDPLLSLQMLLQRPLLGYGLTSSLQGSVSEMGVSFLASLHKLGLIGILLYMTVVFFALKYHYTADTVVLILPLMLTLLVSQPLFEKGIVFFLLFLDTRSLQLARSTRRRIRVGVGMVAGKTTIGCATCLDPGPARDEEG